MAIISRDFRAEHRSGAIKEKPSVPGEPFHADFLLNQRNRVRERSVTAATTNLNFNNSTDPVIQMSQGSFI